MKPPFRIAVLECDTCPPTSVHPGYAGWFGDLLKSGAASMANDQMSPGRDVDIKGWNVVQNPERYPADAEINAVLLTGSKLNAYDNDPWILKLVDYARHILAQDRIRLIGVCFGHQIIGRAMGVKVGRGTLGWEISVHPINLPPKGEELFKKRTLSLHQMHRDIVYDVPPGVDCLGSTPICANQGMYVHGKLISIQAHPEFNSKTMRYLLNARHESGLFDDALYEDAMKRVEDEHDGIAVGQGFMRFLMED